MLEQIQEIVRKNLPAEMGEQLRQFMNEAESQKKSLGYANERIKSFEASVASKDADIVKLTDKLKLAGDLDKREKDVTQREIRLDVMTAQIREGAAVHRADEMKELVSIIFKNPRIVKTAMSNEMVPVVMPGNSYPQTSNASKNETTTKEVNP